MKRTRTHSKNDMFEITVSFYIRNFSIGVCTTLYTFTEKCIIKIKDQLRLNRMVKTFTLYHLLLTLRTLLYNVLFKLTNCKFDFTKFFSTNFLLYRRRISWLVTIHHPDNPSEIPLLQYDYTSYLFIKMWQDEYRWMETYP